MPGQRFVPVAWLIGLCGLVVLLVTTGDTGAAAAGYTEQPLYTFCSQGNCADGAAPDATLIMDKAGNLYGTSTNGGNISQCPANKFAETPGCGVVFELTPKPGGGWTETVLYAFCSQSNCADGAIPFATKLIIDGAGNLYGTTQSGGANNPGNQCAGLGCGVVFELTPKQSGGWTYSVLYNFCSQTHCTDGFQAGGGLLIDKAGNLYGTTSTGGSGGGNGGDGSGVVFELTPKQGGWTYSVLYNFCSRLNCVDGAFPYQDDGLIIDGSGNLYGTTVGGGGNSGGGGVVFELTPNQTGGWTEIVLYAFCSLTNCSDGSNPQASVIMDAKGNLYGTTTSGGASTPGCSPLNGIGCSGVVFELSPKPGGGWTETVLHTFCSQGGANCTDGLVPDGALLMDAAGNLYGATTEGGTGNGNVNNCYALGIPAGCGVVFELTPNSGGGWSYSVLYNFCSQTNCADGSGPLTALIRDGAGNLYGTTGLGGNGNSAGVAFELLLPSLSGIALAAALLPESRSVEVGATATAFATIIDAGPGNASACAIAPQTSVPASFLYQTTNPATNALTGTPNTPVNIAQGASQSFVIAFTPSAAIAPTNIAFNFACANAAAPVPVLSGINTLQLSASTTAVPDIVALAASGDPGYVDIPGATGTGDFAVATVNLGSAAQITASANTGSANLPVTLRVCQTNPSTGACLASPGISVTTTIAANATPTFGVFVTGSAAVPDSPGVNRAFVTFTDANGVLRGETSVAARTQ